LTWLIVLAATAAAVAIFLTTKRGVALSKHLGLRFSSNDAAPREDRDYLLRVCGGDHRAVAALLEEARIHDSEMSEKDAYRKAIRAQLRDKR
jgi:hypothetical protein